ncbi:hypothetical protein QQM39_02265 [Streptomyces sp. DT2A-34]|uniref:hypothetical protein n=1 Tax=Streptomyces sp. DT2A-34 TaxID=3051182 RepID=UPI00265BCE43|nr:hypothetical protein [Streptomyces sp. DT2A-34]MDO0909724.1 hypothetical protein [Streptomyces sp. DT2A-34]
MADAGSGWLVSGALVGACQQQDRRPATAVDAAMATAPGHPAPRARSPTTARMKLEVPLPDVFA